MKLLTKNTDYAVRTLQCLAVSEQCCLSSSEIAERENIPLYFLRRIISVLIKKGWVKAWEGVCGGVSLKVNPRKLTVLEVIQLFQGEVQIVECMFRGKLCENRDSCVFRNEITNMERKVERDFKRITIWSLVNKKKGKHREKKNHKNRRK